MTTAEFAVLRTRIEQSIFKYTGNKPNDLLVTLIAGDVSDLIEQRESELAVARAQVANVLALAADMGERHWTATTVPEEISAELINALDLLHSDACQARLNPVPIGQHGALAWVPCDCRPPVDYRFTGPNYADLGYIDEGQQP